MSRIGHRFGGGCASIGTVRPVARLRVPPGPWWLRLVLGTVSLVLRHAFKLLVSRNRYAIP